MKTIDLAKFRSGSVRALSGRDKGEDVRKELCLASIDSGDEQVTFVIPADIIQVNSSFFLGLIGESVIKLGAEKFNAKYKIQANERLANNFAEAQARALLEGLSLNRNSD